MAELNSFRDDNRGCFSNVRLDNGDPCFIAVAQTGVLVKKSRIGMFGAKLFEETNVYEAAKAAQALDELYPDALTPEDMTNVVLRAFTNAVLHCSTIAEATRVLNEARP